MNWRLILALIFGSAALAVLGDYLGTSYGKKRISLFGLRPKRTSQIITSLTGALIALGVLAVMSVFSQDVRTALFSMKFLQSQLYDLQFQLNLSEKNAEQMRTSLAEAAVSLDLTGLELSSMTSDKILLEQEKSELEATLQIMREESEQLRRDLKALRSEAIALSANVLLGQRAFEAGMTLEEVAEGINDLKQQVRLNVLARISGQSGAPGFNYSTRLRDVPIEFDAEVEELIPELVSSDVRMYVRALSAENYAFGEDMHIMIKLETGQSVLTYPKGFPVYRKFFMNENADAEEILHLFLRDLKNKAISDGILPDPATNNVGTLDGEEFFSAVDELSRIKNPVIINAIAEENIYTEGPIKIDILFEE